MMMFRMSTIRKLNKEQFDRRNIDIKLWNNYPNNFFLGFFFSLSLSVVVFHYGSNKSLARNQFHTIRNRKDTRKQKQRNHRRCHLLERDTSWQLIHRYPLATISKTYRTQLHQQFEASKSCSYEIEGKCQLIF